MTLIKTRREEPLTEAQLKYLEILVIDLNFTLHQRNTHIQSIIDRPCKHLDELSKREASKVITQFKEWKEQKESTAEIEIENRE